MRCLFFERSALRLAPQPHNSTVRPLVGVSSCKRGKDERGPIMKKRLFIFTLGAICGLLQTGIYCRSLTSPKGVTEQDFVIAGVKLGQSIKPVLKVLGKPVKTRAGTAQESMSMYYHYKDFIIGSIDGLLGHFHFWKVGLKTYRGIGVGDKASLIYERYPKEALSEGNGHIFIADDIEALYVPTIRFEVKGGKIKTVTFYLSSTL